MNTWRLAPTAEWLRAAIMRATVCNWRARGLISLAPVFGLVYINSGSVAETAPGVPHGAICGNGMLITSASSLLRARLPTRT